MAKSNTIIFRLDDRQYRAASYKAEKAGMKVNDFARHALVSVGDPVSYQLTVENVMILTGLYNLIEIPQSEWNEQMFEQFRNGVRSLYAVIKAYRRAV